MARTEYPTATSPLPAKVRRVLRRLATVAVGDLDALATVEARRKVEGQWTEWAPVVGLLEGHGAIWAGDGSVVELRASSHTALTLEDGLEPDAPRYKATVAAACAWAGVSTEGTRAELEARLLATP